VLPQWWNRNSWLWGCTHEGCEPKPRIAKTSDTTLQCDHVTLGRFTCQTDAANGSAVCIWPNLGPNSGSGEFVGKSAD